MNERKGLPGRVAWVCIVLLSALAVMLQSLPPRRHVPPARVDEPLPPPAPPAVALWVSTADRRLQLSRQPDIPIDDAETPPGAVIVDVSQQYQSMVGFGAALTDSSAWLMHHAMTAAQRDALVRELFGPPPDLHLNMLRLTIGASDFSIKPYSLDDLPAGATDPTLEHFNVAADLPEVIPTVQQILSVNPDVRIIASPWSPPAWMKTSANLIGGSLLEQYESTYAEYLVKYVDTMRGYGIPLFALTVQNEPAFEPLTYPGMLMPAAVRARLIGQYLGPALARRRYGPRILDWDHNWDDPQQPLAVLGDPQAARYIDGIAWHCYRGTATGQREVHTAYPRKHAYITECSGGVWKSCEDGELMWFARDLLLAGVRQWARGVVYWNLALDERHGPHFGGCGACKGLVTIDSHTGAVTRNDVYYAFGQFSRFVLPGAVRVGSGETDPKINNVAFLDPHNGTVVLEMINSHTDAREVTVAQDRIHFHHTLPAQSVSTFVWAAGLPGAATQPASPSSTGTPRRLSQRRAANQRQ
jgi:glucosylceramidase